MMFIFLLILSGIVIVAGGSLGTCGEFIIGIPLFVSGIIFMALLVCYEERKLFWNKH